MIANPRTSPLGQALGDGGAFGKGASKDRPFFFAVLQVARHVSILRNALLALEVTGKARRRLFLIDGPTFPARDHTAPDQALASALRRLGKAEVDTDVVATLATSSTQASLLSVRVRNVVASRKAIEMAAESLRNGKG